MVSRRCSAALVVAATLMLTACSSETEPAAKPSASVSPSPTTSPTPGTLVGRDAFALTLPKGWTELTEAGGALLLAISDQTANGYPMNVHVVEDTTLAAVTPGQLEDVRRAALTDTGATGVTSLGEYEVDGEQGVRLTYDQRVRSLDVFTVEVTATHGNSGYIVVFSFAPTVAKAEREAVVTNMMDSWTWAQ